VAVLRQIAEDRQAAETAPAPAPAADSQGIWTMWAGSSRPPVEARVIAYLQACDPAISGQGGHDQCFKVFCNVGPGFDLPPETALRLIAQHYNPRCDPPWSDKELRHKVEDAFKAETRRGWLLNEDRDRPTIQGGTHTNRSLQDSSGAFSNLQDSSGAFEGYG